MRKAILLAAAGLFMSAGAALAEGGCDFSGITSASSGNQSQSVATQGATSKPVAKETKG